MKRYNYIWNLKKRIPILKEDPLGTFIKIEDAEKEINFWRQKYEEISINERRAFL